MWKKARPALLQFQRLLLQTVYLALGETFELDQNGLSQNGYHCLNHNMSAYFIFLVTVLLDQNPWDSNRRSRVALHLPVLCLMLTLTALGTSFCLQAVEHSLVLLACDVGIP